MRLSCREASAAKSIQEVWLHSQTYARICICARERMLTIIIIILYNYIYNINIYCNCTRAHITASAESQSVLILHACTRHTHTHTLPLQANILLEQEKRIEQRVLAVRVLQARSRLHATRRQLTDLEKRIAEMRTKSEKATQDAAEAAAELDAHMNAMNRLSSFLARIKTAAIFPPKSPSLVVQGVGAVSTKVESGRVTQAPGVKSSESAY